MPIKIEKSAKLQRLLHTLIYTPVLQIACLRHIQRLCDPQELPTKASHTSVHFFLCVLSAFCILWIPLYLWLGYVSTNNSCLESSIVNVESLLDYQLLQYLLDLFNFLFLSDAILA